MTSRTDQNQHRTVYEYQNNRLSKVVGPSCCGGHNLTLRPSVVHGTINVLTTGTGTESNPADLIPETADQTIASYATKRTDRITNKFGQITRETTPLGSTSEIVYSQTARPIRTIAPDGSERSFVYDSNGLLLEESDEAGNKSAYKYTTSNDLGIAVIASYTDPEGNSTTYNSDNFGRIRTIHDASGGQTLITYNNHGMIKSITDAHGKSTTLEYDDNQNVVSLTSPDGESLSMDYDSVGNLVSTTDALGNITLNEYDVMGRLRSTIEPGGIRTRFRYDRKGNVVAVIDAKGDSITYTYDSSGRRLSETNTLGFVTSYEYDLDGNLLKKRTPNGDEIEFNYDNDDRLVRRAHPSDSILYSYDRRGQLTRTRNSFSDNSYSYDRRGNLVSSRSRDGAQLKYSYDRNSRLVSTSSEIQESEPFDLATVSAKPGAGLELCSGELNGNSVPDFAVLVNRNSSLFVDIHLDFRGNSAGSIASFPVPFLPTSLNQSWTVQKGNRILAADVEADGDQDLVIAGYSEFVILENDGSGGFGLSQHVLIDSVVAKYVNFKLGDLTGDGIAEIIAVADIRLDDDDFGRYSAPGIVYWIRQETGEYTDFRRAFLPSDYITYCPCFGGPSGSPMCGSLFDGDVELADLDLDGDNDVCVAINEWPQCRNDAEWDYLLSIFANVGDSLLTNVTSTYEFFMAPGAMAVADFSDDGYPDIAVSRRNFGVVTNTSLGDRGNLLVFKNRNAGTAVPQFEFPEQYVGNPGLEQFCAIDVDGDQDTDIAALSPSTGTLAYYENRQAIGFVGPRLVTAGNISDVEFLDQGFNPVSAVVLMRLDSLGIQRYGLRDVEAVFFVPSRIGEAHYLSDCTTRFGPPLDISSATTGNVRKPTFGDFNGDGFMDALAFSISGSVASASDVPQYSWLANLHGMDIDYQLKSFLGTLKGDRVSERSINLDGDARSDVAFLNIDGVISMYTVNDSFQVSPYTEFTGFSTGTIARGFEAMDLDDDGDQDFVVGIRNSGLRMVTNSGNGLFELRPEFLSANTQLPMAIGDLNGDGRTDVIAMPTLSNGLPSGTVLNLHFVLAQYQSESFQISLPFNPANVKVEDIDSDDDLDLIVGYAKSSAARPVSILINVDGTGRNWTRHDVSLGSVTVDAIAFDYDGDNILDILGADESQGILFAKGRGGFVFESYQAMPSIVSTSWIQKAEFNNDGIQDIIVGSSSTPTVSLLISSKQSITLFSINREYDNLNRVSQISYNVGSAKRFEANYDYDPMSRLEQINYLNGLSTEFDYDNGDRLSKIATKRYGLPLGADIDYTYDPNGNRNSMSDRLGDHSYSYDPRNQLIGVENSSPQLDDEFYSYDALGNRITSHLSSWHSHNAHNQLLEDEQYEFQYDRNGNMTQRSVRGGGHVTNYRFNPENRLMAVYERPGGGPITDSVTFTYDALGRRISKFVSASNETVKWTYDGMNILTETSSLDGVERIFVHGSRIDDVLAQDAGGQVYVYFKDALGSIKRIVDSSGTTVKQYEYDAFGNIVEETGALRNPFSYTGREWDGETELYFYRNRYYSPISGQFSSDDPLGIAAGTNLRNYVLNRPTVFTDPLGLLPEEIIPCEKPCREDKRNELGKIYEEAMKKSLSERQRDLLKAFDQPGSYLAKDAVDLRNDAYMHYLWMMTNMHKNFGAGPGFAQGVGAVGLLMAGVVKELNDFLSPDQHQGFGHMLQDLWNNFVGVSGMDPDWLNLDPPFEDSAPCRRH